MVHLDIVKLLLELDDVNAVLAAGRGVHWSSWRFGRLFASGQLGMLLFQTPRDLVATKALREQMDMELAMVRAANCSNDSFPKVQEACVAKQVIMTNLPATRLFCRATLPNPDIVLPGIHTGDCAQSFFPLTLK